MIRAGSSLRGEAVSDLFFYPWNLVQCLAQRGAPRKHVEWGNEWTGEWLKGHKGDVGETEARDGFMEEAVKDFD